MLAVAVASASLVLRGLLGEDPAAGEAPSRASRATGASVPARGDRSRRSPGQEGRRREQVASEPKLK